ncbi:CNP1-like family protein [Dokdonella sp.]|uniref:CNP1-like family protein n=1 Tax=Dokdonella sp. TaxID=2291710 RepID=UPI002DD64EFE|nr:CNP1-like family protein [Dokdonella sp.]
MSAFSRRLCQGAFVIVSVALLAAPVAHAQRTALFESDDKPDWKEGEVRFPPYPAPADLLAFDVSSSATASFFIDAKSLSLADDGVVRYTLVVRGAGGAENVTYEGIRCETAERKLYAIGRSGGEWVRSGNDAWAQIADNAFNRQHAALFKDYFCRPGEARPVLDQILRSLRYGALPR